MNDKIDSISKGITESYDWMRIQMEKRTSKYQGHYPWWGWKIYYLDHPEPDLRNERHRWNQDFYRIELNIADNKVLLSDLNGWCCGPMNGRFLPFTEEEDQDFDARWKKSTGANLISLKDLRYLLEQGKPSPIKDPDPELLKEIEDSWERCFDLEAMKHNTYCGGGYVQACFEVLRLDEVKKITFCKCVKSKKNDL